MNQIQPEDKYSDKANLLELVEVLKTIGFQPPKWSFGFNVPIKELAPCSKRRFECDVVAYREGIPACVFELDGHQHVEEAQEKRDQQKERILSRHGIRTWRMWNGELFNIRDDGGTVFRRHVKAHLYAARGTLATDWKTLCTACKKEA